MIICLGRLCGARFGMFFFVLPLLKSDSGGGESENNLGDSELEDRV